MRARWQATEESIIAGCVSMVMYGLFSGQPLTLIGSTGPVLVFETIVSNLCECATSATATHTPLCSL